MLSKVLTQKLISKSLRKWNEKGIHLDIIIRNQQYVVDLEVSYQT